MIADWTVEIGGDSPVLVLPWEGWVDLSHARGDELSEALAYPELVPLLELANRDGCQTAKLDVFPVSRDEVDPEISELPEAATAFGLGSYLDCLLTGVQLFAAWEQLARWTASTLQQETLGGAAAEIVVRAAVLHGEMTYGCTLYAMGFGATERAARATWQQAATLVVQRFLAASRIAVPWNTGENEAGTL